MVQYFLILVVLLLMAGLAIDGSVLQWRQVQLQNAADAAALEGMYQLSRGDNSWSTEAAAQSAANGFTNGSSNVTVTMRNPPTTSVWSGDSIAVQAVVSQTVNNAFMGLVNGAQSTVAASAIARIIPTCVWIMNPTGNTSSTQLALASAGMYVYCGAYVATATGYSLGIDGFASFSTERTRVVGNSTTASTSSGHISPTPRYGSATKVDPLGYVTPPTVSTCSTITSITTNTTLVPGTYCALSISNSATVTLSAGMYIFANGLTVTSSSIVGTSGVTLYFSKTSGQASYTASNINNSAISLKAPTAAQALTYGGITGVVIFTDRNWVNHGNKGINFVNSAITSDGIWYMLNVGLYMWSTPMSYYSYNGLVIDNIYQFGASSVFNTNNYAALGGTSPMHYEDGVLVQ